MAPTAMSVDFASSIFSESLLSWLPEEAKAHTKKGGLLQMRFCQNSRMSTLRGNSLEIRWTWRRHGWRRLAFSVRLNFDSTK